MQELLRDEELFGWMNDQRQCAASLRSQLEREFALVMAYYEGHSWTRIAGPTGTRLEQLRIDQNPDSPNFRVGLNRTSKFTQRAAVATQPVSIQCDVFPSDRDEGSVDEEYNAKVYEDLLNEYIDLTGLVSRWGDGNFGRSVCGVYGIGLCLIPSRTRMEHDGQSMTASDCQLEAFSTLPHKFTLDPNVYERNLNKHEYVMYSDAWSKTKVQRYFGNLLKSKGIDLDDKNLGLRTLGELSTFELSVNALTANRLFAQYKSQSTTPAVLVHQIHRKSGGFERFNQFDVVIEIGGTFGTGKNVRVTQPGQDSPFGGTGLPFVLLHGHRRPDSMWSIGDVKMQVDDQDRLNRTQTYKERQNIANCNYKYVVDIRGMGKDKTPDAIRKRINNSVGGIITWESGIGPDKGNPPHIMQVPSPQQYLSEEISRYEDAMRQQTHAAPGNFGELKTHTPDASFQRAMDEAAQVLDMRISEDKTAMESLLHTVLGTVCKLVKDQSPSTLGLLVERGYTESELATIADTNSQNPPCTIKVRDSSIRMRSYSSRKQDLFQAAQLATPAIDGPTLRRELAMMDASLTTDDAYYRNAFQKAARDVLLGAQWQPIPLGERTGDLLGEFRKALLDRRADQAAKQRLSMAIMQQEQMVAQEQALAQPPQPAEAAPAQQPDQAQASFSDVLTQLQQQVSSRPELAAA